MQCQDSHLKWAPLQNCLEFNRASVRAAVAEQEWAAHPDVLYAHPLVEAGKRVTGGGDGMPTWVCEFMVTKPTVEEAIEFVTQIEQSLQAPPTPLCPLIT